MESLRSENTEVQRISLSKGAKSISKALFNGTNGNIVLKSDFITEPAELRTPDPILDLYLNGAPASLLGDPESMAVSFDLSPGLREWYEEIGLLRGKLIELGTPTDVLYPGGSVEKTLIERLKQGDEALLEALKGRTPVNNFPSTTTEEIAEMLGTEALIDSENTIKYHSKHWLRGEWKEGETEELSYNVAPGFTLRRVSDIYKSFKSLLPYFNGGDQLPIWIKFASFSAGDGVFKAKLEKNDLENPDLLIKKMLGIGCEKSAAEVARTCGYIDESATTPVSILSRILEIFPIVIEVDLGALPNTERVIANFNIQAVIGEHGTSLVDTSLQKTGPDGNYMGNSFPLPPEIAQEAVKAEQQFLLACARIREDGYKGYIGGDVILRQRRDGEYDATVIDLNPRLNGSTPFNSHVHLLREQGGEVHGLNTNLILPDAVTTFHEIRDKIGDLLLNFARGDRQGLVPAAMRGNPKLPNKVIKMSVMAQTQEALDQILSELKHRNIRYGSF